MTTQPTPTAGRLNATAAAEYTGVGRRTWFRWRSTDARLRRITHVDPAGRAYWLRDELDAWLRENPPPVAAAAPEPPAPATKAPRPARVTMARTAPEPASPAFAANQRQAGAVRRRTSGFIG